MSWLSRELRAGRGLLLCTALPWWCLFYTCSKHSRVPQMCHLAPHIRLVDRTRVLVLVHTRMCLYSYTHSYVLVDVQQCSSPGMQLLYLLCAACFLMHSPLCSKIVINAVILKSLHVDLHDLSLLSSSRKSSRLPPKIQDRVYLSLVSRPTYAFTVRYATENEGRGALKPILKESARSKKPSRIRGSSFRYWVRHDETCCQSLPSRWSYTILCVYLGCIDSIIQRTCNGVQPKIYTRPSIAARTEDKYVRRRQFHPLTDGNFPFALLH